MRIPIYQVDAFTAEPFRGNPAGVCLLDEPLPDRILQHIAMEMNLSETAFLLRRTDGFRLRWFTPLVEVKLCGHATLASAHLLFERGCMRKDQVARFHTRSGLLTARYIQGWIELDFPQLPARKVKAPALLLEALKLKPLFVGRNGMDYLVEVKDEAEVRGARPDFDRLARSGARGVIVTAAAKKKYDFVSRFFAPAVGINEDPVTGSAHCCLGPFWAAKLNKRELSAAQVSSRGGVLQLRLEGKRIRILGQAVTVLAGELQF